MEKQLERSGLSQKDVQILLSVTNPDSRDNPWHDRAIRVTTEKPFIKIISRLKTRDVLISVRLVRMFTTYISEVRKQFPCAKKHDYLFVSENGNPLSRQDLNKIFADLMDRVPRLSSKISASACKRYAATQTVKTALQKQRDINHAEFLKFIINHPSKMLYNNYIKHYSQYLAGKEFSESEIRSKDEERNMGDARRKSLQDHDQ
jgi:hypothetical protein